MTTIWEQSKTPANRRVRASCAPESADCTGGVRGDDLLHPREAMG